MEKIDCSDLEYTIITQTNNQANNQPTNQIAMSSDLAKRVEVLEKQIALLLKTDIKEDVKVKKPKKAPKAESSDDEKPKVKRTSGYIIFSNATRDEVKTKLSVGDEKPKNTEVMKELAVMWKALEDEEREEWNAKAQQVRDAAA